MNNTIVNVGSINMDLIVRSPRIPKPGETIIGSGFHTAPGGKGANQSVTAARLGGPVSHIGRVGQDEFGKSLVMNMRADGVDCKSIIEDEEEATGVALIVVEDDGENSIVVASGANMRLSPQDIDYCKDQITSAKILLLQLEVPLDTVLYAAKIAQEGGCTVVLNPAPAQPLPIKLLQSVDILVPNESETKILTGLPVGSENQLDRAASKLLDLGVETIMLTLGERGSRLIKQGQTKHIPSFEVKTVDTTAAGDAFVGAVATALFEGNSLEQAALWGNAAGALATTRLGAQPSLPAREELENIIKR